MHDFRYLAMLEARLTQHEDFTVTRRKTFEYGAHLCDRLAALECLLRRLWCVGIDRDLAATHHLGASRVVAHERLMEEAEAIAQQILRNSQTAVRSAKETILDVIGRPLDDQLRLEALNAYSCADPEETMGLLRRFYDRTDPGRL